MTPEFFLKRTLQLAENGRFLASPNPMVGCVIVKNHQIIGEGWHQGPGTPHAEIMALQAAGAAAGGADLYVNLEPCCHFGRTPPCTTSIIQAGIARVFACVTDPNPLVAGQGFQVLADANIDVQVGCLEQEAREFNRIFFHFMKYRRPYVIAKWAMSLDGIRTATKITNLESQAHVHALRCQVDAILIGKNTAILDDPQLTTRYLPVGVAPRHPVRLVLDSFGETPDYLKLYHSDLPGKTIMISTKPGDFSHREKWLLPENKKQQVSLPHLLERLGESGITSLLVEGGPSVHEDFFEEGLVNEVQVYLAPKIFGRLNSSLILNKPFVSSFGNDHFFQIKLGEEKCL